MRLNLTTPRSSFGWPADSARSRPALAISICRHGSMMMRARNGELDAIRSGAFSLKNTHIYIYIYGRLNSSADPTKSGRYLNRIIHKSTTKRVCAPVLIWTYWYFVCLRNGHQRGQRPSSTDKFVRAFDVFHYRFVIMACYIIMPIGNSCWW